MAETALHVIISGRVQGVWFRDWTKQQASSLGLTGWVRNRRDGTVEAIFQGDAADIDAMLNACWQGPPAASVADIRVADGVLSNFHNFRHLPTI
ncbi:MAG: acylphosphatase [Alphaproteobacteria bacterium]|nr:acylphosphatase [Alphaproteobacteria bacterium]